MINVLQKAVTILRLLVPEGNVKEWSATEVARRAGLPVGTVHRILLELKKHGMVVQNDNTKKFRLGLMLIELGFIARENLSIVESAKTFLKDLAEKTQETVHLTVQDDCEGVLIDKIDTVHHLRLAQPIGMRTPLTRGALKKVILAYLPSDEINRIVNKIEEKYTRKGVNWDKGSIMEELERIRNNGYAISYGEVTPGTGSIASPVFDIKGQVVASIGIVGPESRFSGEELPQKIECVKTAGIQLTKNISGILK